MRTLDILERGDWALLEECEQKGRYLLEGLRQIQERYPDVLKEVRGAGLMVGVEFQDLSRSSSSLLRQLSAQADLVYCMAGYLLHEHRIRVAATLSDSFTLRVQPSLLVTRDEIDRFLSAIERLAQILHHHDGFSLCKYVVGMASPGQRVEILDCRRSRVEDTPVPGASRVAFLGHLIEARHLADYEETFRRMPEEKLDQFLRALECRLSPALLRSVNVRSRLGSVVNFNFIGMTMTSRRVAELMRSGDLRALRKLIDEAIGIARQHGCTVIGLGQYTSMITQNCTDLVERDIAVTSGNSLTVAMGVEGLVRAAAEAGIPPAMSTLGVVGAGGNISSAFASTMAERVSRIVLFGRPTAGAEEKCYRTAFRVYRDLLADMRHGDPGASEGMAAEIYATRSAQSILRRQVSDGDLGQELFFALRAECGEDRFIRVSLDLRELRESALVVAAANAAEPFIGPEHLRPDAVVCDMAVPLNTRREVARERSDVRVVRGGVMRLPFDEDLGLKAIPLKPGHVFACMAETMLLGLTGIDCDYSYGDLEKQRVKAIREIARVHGFELDSERPH
jgi:predicted amino acid dehydrogenase